MDGREGFFLREKARNPVCVGRRRRRSGDDRDWLQFPEGTKERTGEGGHGAREGKANTRAHRNASTPEGRHAHATKPKMKLGSVEGGEKAGGGEGPLLPIFSHDHRILSQHLSVVHCQHMSRTFPMSKTFVPRRQ